MQQGITGEAVTQIQTECPTKQINGNDVLNSHFSHGAFIIYSYFQEANGEKNKQELSKKKRDDNMLYLAETSKSREKAWKSLSATLEIKE